MLFLALYHFQIILFPGSYRFVLKCMKRQVKVDDVNQDFFTVKTWDTLIACLLLS